jgi:hypothetical protein
MHGPINVKFKTSFELTSGLGEVINNRRLNATQGDGNLIKIIEFT